LGIHSDGLFLEDHPEQPTSASQFGDWEYLSQGDRNLINGVAPEYKHFDNPSVSINDQQFWSADSSFYNNVIDGNLLYNHGVNHFDGSMVGAVQDYINFDPTFSLLNNNAAPSTGFYNPTPKWFSQPNSILHHLQVKPRNRLPPVPSCALNPHAQSPSSAMRTAFATRELYTKSISSHSFFVQCQAALMDRELAIHVQTSSRSTCGRSMGTWVL
jgi:hypothetical protein